MAGDLKPLPNVSEEMERELVRAISLDDGALFQKLLGQGISAFHIFRGYENEGGDLGTFHKPIAQVIVIKNALRIASTFFDLQDMQAQFEYKAPVAYAIVFGTPEMVRLMVDKGFDVNKKRVTQPPLLAAAIKGCLDCCKALIGSGRCNPYAKDQHDGPHEDRPLCEAARQGRLDIVKLIVEFKKDRRTLVRSAIVAAENGHEEVALYLLDALDAGRKKGGTEEYPYHIIMVAAEHRLMKIVDRVLAQEPRTLHLINDHKTPLAMACKNNHIELLEQLIAMGADVHAVEDSRYFVYTGKTFMACNAEELWDAGYNPAPNAGEMKIAQPLHRQSPSSPLAEAAASGHLGIVKMLVGLGVDPETAYIKAPRPGLTMALMFNVPAIELARAHGHAAVVDYLSGVREAAAH